MQHFHLSIDERAKAESLLKNRGYTLLNFDEDTLAETERNTAEFGPPKSKVFLQLRQRE